MRPKSVLAAILAVFCLALFGCDRKDAEKSETVTLDIYATVFPIYAIAQRITRDVPDMNLHCLIDPQDNDFELYALSERDMALLSGADAVIMGGGGLESFAFEQSEKMNSPAVIELLSGMDLLVKEESEEVNPHIYVTAEGIHEIASRLKCAMSLLDPRYDKLYEANYCDVEKEVHSLTDTIAQIKEKVNGSKVIVMDDSCAYIAREYGLEPIACVDRCSGSNLEKGETDSAFSDILPDDCTVVLVEAQAPAAMRSTLEREGYSLVLLDVLTNGTRTEGFEGMIDRLRTNAEIIEKAFGNVA